MSIDSIDMVTTIQIKEKTKIELLKVLSKLQATSTKKITYEDVIQYLLLKERCKMDKRRLFTSKYAGILADTDAHELLRESRRLERK